MEGLKVAKVSGRAGSGVWSQAFSFDGGGLGATGGFLDALFLVVVVRSGKQYVDLGSFGKGLVARLQEKFRQGITAGLDSLETVVRGMVGNSEDLEVELVVVGRSGDRVFLVASGGGMVGLYRRGKLGQVLKSEGGLVKSQGNLRFGDVLVAGSSEFFRVVKYDELTEVFLEVESREGMEMVGGGVGLGGSGVDYVASRLALKVGEAIDSRGVAGMVIGYGSQEAEEESEQEEEKSLEDGKKRKLPAVSGISSLMKGVVSFGPWGKLVSKVGFRKFRVRGDKQEQVYVKRRGGGDLEKKRKRVGVVVFVVLVALLVVSVFLGYRKRVNEVREAKVMEVIGPARELYEQALLEKQVNRLRARSLLEEAKEVLISGLEGFKDGSGQREIEEFLAEVDEEFVRVSGRNSVEAEVFLDLKLIREDFFGEKMAVVDEEVLVLDTSRGVVIGVGVESKEPRVVAGGESLKGSSFVAGSGEEVYVLASVGVVRAGEDNEVVVATDEDWEEVGGMDSFASAVYVLDRGKGEVWKYSAVDSGDFVRRRWLAPGVAPDFSNVVDMTIDGDVWVLDSDGSVRQYSKGASRGFGLVGLDESVESAQAVYAAEDGVYVVDRGGGRVLVFDLDGNYRQQYIWDGIATVTDMVVVDKKILLLSGSTIYEINLNEEEIRNNE